MILTWIHEYIDGFFIGRDFSWDDMWMNFNDCNVTSLEWFLSEKPTISKRVCFSCFQASALFNFSRKYAPLKPHEIPIIFSQKYQHDICFALAWHTRPEVVANQRLEVRPDFLGWEPERANGCNEERTAVACFFDVLSLYNFFRHKVVPHMPRSSGT